ncbi:hypothetical protein [Phaeodactylibacter xiamenensis]|uniref:hypothetical protein n=1 Tax=Phaeodactylibacter xiamenensis TaxID=1524460 RepID=UPI0024A7B704|nr:hypothetical protein [Phaeodactylibacter xiamenensis]
MNNPNPITINIEPEWLSPGYYVYVVEMKTKDKTYLYIGQTGDNNYTTARAPLYRLSGHFVKGRSTENQIIKYLKATVEGEGELNNKQLDNLLTQTRFSYRFWKLDDFDGKDHEAKRMKAQMVEHYLIFHLQMNSVKKEIVNSEVVNEVSESKMKYFSKEQLDSLKLLASGLLKTI